MINANTASPLHRVLRLVSFEVDRFELMIDEREHSDITSVNWHTDVAAGSVASTSFNTFELGLLAFPGSGPMRDTPMMRSRFRGVFELSPESIQHTEQHGVPAAIGALMAETVLSTARGVILARTKGTVLERHPLPYYDGGAIIFNR